MQGLVGGAFEGAGVAIGSLAGGALYKSQARHVDFSKFPTLAIFFVQN
jgi:hypothetical protein